MSLPPASATPPPITPLTTDLPCARCRYNLRTLAPTARCPECGTPIADSLAFHDRYAGLRFRPLAWGFTLLALIPVIDAPGHGLNHLLEPPHFYYHQGVPFAVKDVLCLLDGVILLLAVLLLVRASSPRRAWLAWVYLGPPVTGICVALLFLLWIGLFSNLTPDKVFFNPPPGMRELFGTFYAVYSVFALWYAVVCFMGASFLRALSRRLHQPRLTVVAPKVLIFIALTSLLRCIYGAYQGLHPGRTPWGPWGDTIWRLTDLLFWPELVLQLLLWSLLAFTIHRVHKRSGTA